MTAFPIDGEHHASTSRTDGPVGRSRRKRTPMFKLAAGYRLMAWHSLRRGDLVTAAAHAACARALIDYERSGHPSRYHKNGGDQ